MREVDLGDELGVELALRQHDRFGPRARGKSRNDNKRASHVATVTCALALVACQQNAAETSGAFYNWDGRTVHCAVNIDTYARNDLDSIKTGLARAKDRGEVLEIYAHDPGRTITWDELEGVLAAISDSGLPYYTYADFAHGAAPGAGVSLSFDDAYVDHWLEGSELYARYNARLTFFIAYFPELSAEQVASLHELARLGHAIEAHSVKHLRAPLYVEQHGLSTYITDEAEPSIDALKEEGFDVTTYAYPYGARTSEIDHALSRHVSLLRSVSFTWSSIAADPCPN